MFFHFGFMTVESVFLTVGFLMFAYPAMYVRLANWYFTKTGSTQRLSVEKYERRIYRLAGLFVFLLSVAIFAQYVMLLRK